ncbi:unnamed protein product [Vicia faba]|uniref:Uncharacterized protein n=1 Tax=Vicia faba TaxID=3906 RepID=A0AAV0YVE2_VICFA|nr:unnamed protein product [Vicia faba]
MMQITCYEKNNNRYHSYLRLRVRNDSWIASVQLPICRAQIGVEAARFGLDGGEHAATLTKREIEEEFNTRNEFNARYHYNIEDNRLGQHVDKGIEDSRTLKNRYSLGISEDQLVWNFWEEIQRFIQKYFRT